MSHWTTIFSGGIIRLWRMLVFFLLVGQGFSLAKRDVTLKRTESLQSIEVPFDPVKRILEKSVIRLQSTVHGSRTLTDSIIQNDFLINDDLTGGSNQDGLSIAMDGQGNFVIGWYEFRNGDADAFGQRFNASGTPVGQNFRFNQDATMKWQGDPAVAMSAAGGLFGSFIAAWEDRRDCNSDVYIQRYDNNGNPLDTNFRANDDGTRTDQRGTAAIVKPDGEFIVVWEDWRNDWGDIYGQRFSAQGIPIGINFKVNDDIGGTQYGAAIACDSLGNFVVVWMDGRNGNWDIYGQRYNSQGVRLGSNFRINDDPTTQVQWAPSVAVAPNGNFVVVWEDQRYDSMADIYGQRYNASGVPIGANFFVNDISESYQNSPAVAIDRSGNFIVVWADYRNGNYDIYCRRFDANGNPLGASFRVNDDITAQNQTSPVIAITPNSDFWIAWSCGRNLHTDVYVQHYSSAGTPIGNNFKVNDDSASSQQRVSMIAIDGKSNYIVIWEDERDGLFRTDIYAQRLDSLGNPMGNNFRVNDDIGNAYQFYSSVAADFVGNFTCAWTDGRNASYDIYAQRFDQLGNRVGVNIKVNDDLVNAHQWYPWVGMDSMGNSVIVWMDTRDDNAYDIFAQRFDNNGNPIGANFKVNDALTGSQLYGSVAQNRAGYFVVAWMDNRDGDYNIYAQRYDANGNPIGPNFRVDDDQSGNYAGYPAVAIDNLANFVVVWEDSRNGNTDIYGQIYNSYGQRIGNNFRVNDDATEEDQYSPSVYTTSDGRFIVVWCDWRYGDGDPEIFAQRFLLNGIRIGSNCLINEPDTFNYCHQWTIGQSVVCNNDRIAFAWTDNRRHKGFDIYGKVTDWNLVEIDDTFDSSLSPNLYFVVYPNPTTGKITIALTNAGSASGSFNVCLFDACGRLRKKFVASSNEHSVSCNLSNLAKGVYFVTLDTGDEILSRKIILR